jgi:hypothetical protein
LADPEIAANVRRLSGVEPGHGPNDQYLAAAVEGFIEAFDYWYIRVIREAVPKYRTLIVQRINPLIRIWEFEGLDASSAAFALVEAYNARNFVTAGGWALEEMAVSVSVDAQKSAARGIDIQRYEPDTGDYHLYVMKSGLVTRNSDIMSALKKHSRDAEKLLLQGRTTGHIRAKYAILQGKTSSTFEDGIWRPSSAEFWSEMTDLPEEDAVNLALAIAAEAGRLVRTDSTTHLEALRLVVASYIRMPDGSGEVDWPFITLRTMRPKDLWREEDSQRHKQALESLEQTGYVISKKAKKKS